MDFRTLGTTGIRVSRVCLGTMTWGEQNTEAEAHAQMDLALSRGVNFFDTAEMYPIPNRAETCGRTESFIGSWFKRRRTRDRVVLATKAAGPGVAVPRGGKAGLDPANLRLALEASLKRLGTDCIDLYQVHWPERGANYFGQLGYVPAAGDDGAPIAETLAALAAFVGEGKVRAIGVANETAWGVMAWLREADRSGGSRIASVQNPYSLLNRSFEVGLAEVCHREDVALLAYSPLAFGALAGKYLDGAWPAGARLTLFRGFKRYLTPPGRAATAEYVRVAREAGLDPAQMALAYVHSRPFVAATILGATTVAQLESDLAGVELALAPDVLDAIEAVHRVHTYPCP